MAKPGTMRAWLYSSASGGLEKNLKLHEDAPRPPSSLSKDQVLISVLAMSVNPVDFKIPELGIISNVVISKPASPGMDFCGKVEKIGAAVDSLKIGELVLGNLGVLTKFGTLGEYIVVKEECVVPLPDGVGVEAAATIGVCGQTAYQAIQGNIKSGEKVFINGGSGGTGTYCIQIAKALGCHVTTTCSTGNVQLCKELGADEVIDYKTKDVVSALKEQVQEFSLIVDNVGTPEDLYRECHHFLKPDGRFIQVGAQMGLGDMKGLMSRKLLPSFLGGGKRSWTFLAVKNNQDGMKRIAAWIAAGTVNPVIQEVIDFENAAVAYEKLKSGRVRGKIVVRVRKE